MERSPSAPTTPVPFPPWILKHDPTSGKGYESAVAYEVADRLGFTPDEVKWVTVPFNKSYAPGPKDFDFDINQISVTPDREKAVDVQRAATTTSRRPWSR